MSDHEQSQSEGDGGGREVANIAGGEGSRKIIIRVKDKGGKLLLNPRINYIC